MSDTIPVTVTLKFGVPPERVFDAWIRPELIGQWMFGPSLRDEQIVRIESDAKASGKFSFVVDRQGQVLDHNGTYLEYDRPNRLVFTWAVGEPSEKNTSRVSVDIRPSVTQYSVGSGCELTLTHEIRPEWAAWAGKTEQGWRLMLGALWNLLE